MSKRYFVSKAEDGKRPYYMVTGGKVYYQNTKDWNTSQESCEYDTVEQIIASGKFTEVNADMTPVTTKPAFPRYFKFLVPGFGAYLRFDSEEEAVTVQEDGSEKRGGTWYMTTNRVELTREEAEALVKKPEPVVRWFVRKDGIAGSDGVDHIRLNGEKFVCVYPDGSEGYCNWDFPAFPAAAGSWKEVFPNSSESLLRSHRYAEKYEEGKAAGKKEAAQQVSDLQLQVCRLKDDLRLALQQRDNLRGVSAELVQSRKDVNRLEARVNTLSTAEGTAYKRGYEEGVKDGAANWIKAYNREVNDLGLRISRAVNKV